MKLETITMEKDEAKEAFEQYRDAVRLRHDAEDEAIMRGYRELAKGSQLIKLSETVAAGGMVETFVKNWRSNRERIMCPALAVARANERFCWTFGIGADGHCNMRSKREIHERNFFNRIMLPAGTFPADEDRQLDSGWQPSLKAMVPIVPPPLRPKFSLSNYHVLWEVEKWEQDPVPPADPALLKRIGGDLYAVLAVWDLTDLERAVLAGRTD